MAQAIDRELPDMLERYEIPGAAVSLVRDGEIVWSAEYGYADREEQQPVTRRTVFEAGSIGKSLTALPVSRDSIRRMHEPVVPVSGALLVPK